MTDMSTEVRELWDISALSQPCILDTLTHPSTSHHNFPNLITEIIATLLAETKESLIWCSLSVISYHAIRTLSPTLQHCIPYKEHKIKIVSKVVVKLLQEILALFLFSFVYLDKDVIDCHKDWRYIVALCLGSLMIVKCTRQPKGKSCLTQMQIAS